MITPPTSVRTALRLWPDLAPPELQAVEGRWEAAFLTPLRAVAPRGLGLMGLPCWYGKQLTTEGGINLVRTRAGTLSETLPMTLREDASWLNAGPALVAGYAADARRPWRWVRDELRVIDADTLLGLTFTDRPGLRRAGLPFLLHRRG